MTRVRLRPAHTAAKLAEIYATPHDHTRWTDHRLRVAATIEVARWMAEDASVTRAADLSCGDGTILLALDVVSPHFGDLADHYPLAGPIEETIHQIPGQDLFICTETLEHLDDPDKVLAEIRRKTRLLILSTPVDAWDDPNVEHYWAWSRTDVEDMLTAAGFAVAVYTAVDLRPQSASHYQFGIWGLR